MPALMHEPDIRPLRYLNMLTVVLFTLKHILYLVDNWDLLITTNHSIAYEALVLSFLDLCLLNPIWSFIKKRKE
jgi:hypothetical protein